MPKQKANAKSIQSSGVLSLKFDPTFLEMLRTLSSLMKMNKTECLRQLVLVGVTTQLDNAEIMGVLTREERNQVIMDHVNLDNGAEIDWPSFYVAHIKLMNKVYGRCTAYPQMLAARQGLPTQGESGSEMTTE